MPTMWQEQSLFKKPAAVTLTINKNHPLVKLSDVLQWSKMIEIAMQRREQAKIALSGPPPQYRQLLGSLVLMSVRNLNYRDTEDLIANYAPARYLCDLLDSSWTPDHATIFHFNKMLGVAGMQQINEQILGVASSLGFSDPSQLMSDTTAQEARIPYPNEAGLMNRFMGLVGRGVSRLRGQFDGVKKAVAKAVAKTKGLLRNAHLFAKGRDQKRKIEKKMYHTVRRVQQLIEEVVNRSANVSSKAARDLIKVNEVMKKLLPQIRHFLTTGFVAAQKIIHLQIPEIYAITRGKAGKSVEFGLKWGISRIGGGFVAGFLMGDGEHRSDSAFCLESIRRHKAMYGEAPKVFGFDRGGDSVGNVKKALKLGVKYPGIAPKGKRAWSVGEKMREKIVRARAQVEGSIGTIKSSRYGFTKPRAHSKAAMVACGHRAIMGFNMMKLATMSGGVGSR